jgi:hypothetical protein
VPLLTPENLPDVLTAAAAVIAALGGWTWFKVRREPPKPGSPDAMAVAMAENTKAITEMVAALRGQNAHFADNNEMFKALGPTLAGMAKDFADIRHDGAEAKGHLASIRDSLNRRTR